MKRALLILALCCACVRATAGTADSSGQQKYAALDSLMHQYLAAIQHGSIDSKIQESDFMIGAAADTAVRRHIALALFDHYKEAPVMGDEAVAIHIFDKWFATKAIAMRSEFDEMDARLFADFNRHSLIGMQAAKITLLKPCRGKMTIPEEGTAALLWFHDTSCGKCKMEAKVLPDILAKVDYPLNFYAVYAGQSKKEWRAFRRSFRIPQKNVRLVHLWDPEIESDYLSLYGVISTPKLYLTAPDGTIIGRRLEPESLAQMIPILRAIVNNKE